MQLIWVLFIAGVLLFPTPTHAQPCQDVPPPAGSGQTQYSCSDQKKWGKCGQSWMQGYCLVSCNACPTAPPTPPPTIKPVPFQITSKLSVSGTNLQMNGKNVFLNGANMAWQNYGSDFGFSGPYNYPSQIKTTLQQINQHGGNSMRMWVHCSGLNSPLWDSTGKVTGLPQDFLTSLQQFLRDAKSYNIFVTLVLWNFMITDNHAALYKDDTVLQSYITNALTPMVTALKNEQALAAWEISNEPEGTSVEFGWQTNKVPMASIQKAINWQADAIHKADPTALVTVGSWAADANTDVGGFKNYYTNDQLSKAGGKKQGYLDFYQLHYYAWMKRNNPRSLIDNSFAYYQLDKPLVMGEFSQSSTQTVAPGITIGQIYGHAYDTGYAGAWGWQFAGGQDSDTPDVILQGISSLSSTRALVHDVSLDGDVNGEFDVPTTTTSTSTLSMGLIIGVSIAGSVLLIVLVLGAIMCHRRKQHTVTVQHLHEIQDTPAVQLTQV